MKKFIGIILFVVIIISITTIASAMTKEEKQEEVYDNLSYWVSNRPGYEDFIINEADDGYVRYISTIESVFFTERDIDYHNYKVIKDWFENEYPIMLKDLNNTSATCEFNKIGCCRGQWIYMVTITLDKPQDEIIGFKFIASFY